MAQVRPEQRAPGLGKTGNTGLRSAGEGAKFMGAALDHAADELIRCADTMPFTCIRCCTTSFTHG
jgi:hypothetical protein